MNLHKFYLNNIQSTRKLSPILYAYTNDERYFESFIEARNDKVLTHISSQVTESEYRSVCFTFPSRQLTRSEFKTRSNEDPTDVDFVPLVCTWEEEKTVCTFSENILASFKLYNTMFNTKPLSIEVNESLYKLGYFNIYNLLYRLEYVYKPIDPYFDGMFVDEMDIEYFKNIKYDEFSIFVHLYGNTLKDTWVN